MASTSFTPLHDRILVRRMEEGESIRGGIIIPDTAKEKPQEGEVIAVGKGKSKDVYKRQNYFCDAQTLATLKRDDRIAFRYANAEGKITAEANPNGSLENIAGILSAGRNVLGMMPHPDRSSESLLGSADGLKLFRSMAESLAGAAR